MNVTILLNLELTKYHMKSIDSSRLVKLLNNGLSGEVILSGNVNAYRKGNESTAALFRSRGRFTLSRDKGGTYELRSFEESVDCSFYFRRRDTSVRLTETGHMVKGRKMDEVVIPIDLAEFANVIIEPEEIRY